MNISESTIQEIKEISEQDVREKELKEWKDFFYFLYEVFEHSPYCGDINSCKHLNKMTDKIKEMLKKEGLIFPL